MIKLDKSYSDYTDETDGKYPAGKAINASSSESYDGTPWFAEMMNDEHGARQAIYKAAYGSVDGLSGVPDNVDQSDTLDAIKKLIDDPDKAHADLRGEDAHGATVEASPGQIVSRDEYGRAKFAAPVDGEDAARKSDVDDAEARAKNLANATGVLAVAKGGTGAETQNEINYNIVKSMLVEDTIVNDGSEFVMSVVTPSSSQPNFYKRQALKLWEYIKEKISSVLGLTASNYRGTSAKAKADGNGNNIVETYQRSFSFELNGTKKYLHVKGDVSFLLACRYEQFIFVQRKGVLVFGDKYFSSGYYIFMDSNAKPNYYFELKGYNAVTMQVLSKSSGAIVVEELTELPEGITLETYTASQSIAVRTIATTSKNGLMSSTDKAKLDGINSNIITCSTAIGTSAKTVSASNFSLFTGATVRVIFTNGNDVANPTLNVNGTGAKQIRALKGGSKLSITEQYGSDTAGAYKWQNNTILELYYDGTYWVVVGNPIVNEYSSSYSYLSETSYRVFIDGYKEINLTVDTRQSDIITLPFYLKTVRYIQEANSNGWCMIGGSITTNGNVYVNTNQPKDGGDINTLVITNNTGHFYTNIKITGYACGCSTGIK